MAVNQKAHQTPVPDSIMHSQALGKNIPLKRGQSLIVDTMLQMAIRITIVIIAVAFFSYWHITNTLEEQTKDKLYSYINERGNKESIVFKIAEHNHAIFKQKYLENYQNNLSVSANEWNLLFQKKADGTTRTRPELYNGFIRNDGTISRYITGYIGKDAPVDTADFQKRVVLGWKLVDRFADAWSQFFANLYVHSEENFNIVYWPGLRWADNANSNLKIIQEEWAITASVKNNPDRIPVWTGMYFDPTAVEWMVSLETPIDYRGRHLLTVGHDLLLNELFRRVNEDKLQGATNFIFKENGRLIIHPDHLEAIKASNGRLTINETNNEELISFVNHIISEKERSGKRTMLIDDSQNDAYLAAYQLDGPNWWFVTVYPKSLLKSAAIDAAELILLIGLISLVIELIALYLVIRNKIILPLKTFSQASELISAGNYQLESHPELKLPTDRNDEIGIMSQAFINMCENVQLAQESLEQEVTERTLHLDNALREQKAIFNNAYIGILLIKNGKIVSCNKRFEEITGYKTEEVIGQKQHILSVNNTDLLSDITVIKRKIIEHGSYMLDSECKHKNGVIFWCSIQFKPIDSQDLDSGIVLTMVDITKRRNAELLLAREARIDGLTGIGNRRAFDEAIIISCRHAQREGHLLTLAIIDVDYFKNFNDTYGHVAGDEALIKIAKQIAKAARRPYELAARYGGEEFALIIHGEVDVIALLEKLRENVFKLNIKHSASETNHLTISTGAVSISGSQHVKINAHKLIEQADEMLYQAKASGRNKVKFKLI